jgi:hypothetical protein
LGSPAYLARAQAAVFLCISFSAQPFASFLEFDPSLKSGVNFAKMLKPMKVFFVPLLYD